MRLILYTVALDTAVKGKGITESSQLNGVFAVSQLGQQMLDNDVCIRAFLFIIVRVAVVESVSVSPGV